MNEMNPVWLGLFGVLILVAIGCAAVISVPIRPLDPRVGESRDAYRVYVLTDDDRIKDPPIIIDALDETAAIEEASQFLDRTAIEVWDQDRLIARLEPPKDGNQSRLK